LRFSVVVAVPGGIFWFLHAKIGLKQDARPQAFFGEASV
jgi:hypothetical protein